MLYSGHTLYSGHIVYSGQSRCIFMIGSLTADMIDSRPTVLLSAPYMICRKCAKSFF